MGSSLSSFLYSSPPVCLPLPPCAPTVVIVGGGYGGTSVAKKLDQSGRFNVLLIDRKNYFFHNVAAVRTAAEQHFASDVMIPYANLLKNGSFVQADVEEIQPDGVKLVGYASPIRFDYLVIALGSSYNFPGKSPQSDRSSALLQYGSVYESIRCAASTTLVGGGLTGVEIAAEIATQFPDKKVRLIHGHSSLLPERFPSDVRDHLLKELQRLNVEVVLNERVQLTEEQKLQLKEDSILRSKSFPSPFSLRTVSGRDFDQQVAVLCSGAEAASAPLTRNFAAVLDDAGRLKVNEFLQVEGFRNIFALGDIAAKEAKQAYLAGQQANAVIENLELLAASKPLRAYQPADKLAVFLSLGKSNGVGKFGNYWFPSWLVTWMKSKDLLVGQLWTTMNAAQIRHQVKQEDMKWMQQQNLKGEEKREGVSEDKVEVVNNDLTGSDEAVEARVKNLQRFFQVDKQRALSILRRGIAAD